MRRLSPLFGFFLLLLCAHTAQSQGAIDGFMKGKGNTDIALTYSYESYDTYFFGREPQDISVTTQTINLFATGGFNNRLDWVVALPYLWVDSLNRSVQDAILAIKYRNSHKQLSNGELDVITSVGVSFPVGNYEVGPLGQRAFFFQPRLLVQYKDNSGFFVNILSGIDFRMTPSSLFSIPVISRVGFAGAKFYVDAWIDFYGTLEPGVDTQVGAGEGAVWWRVGGTFYVPVSPRVGLFVGGAYFLGGRNIGQAARLNVGGVYKFFKKQNGA